MKLKNYLFIITFLGILLFIFISHKNINNNFNRICECASPLYADTASIVSDSFALKLVDAALERTRHSVIYDGRYMKIDYPNGDVPDTMGVCTDVVIRSYRKLGIDLQKLVHQDMKNNFDKYPKIWGLKKPDSNIDHRRVPNLMTFFKRNGKVLPKSLNPKDYTSGNIVAWDLNGRGLTHIGIVSTNKVPGTDRPMIIHNIGAGPSEDDILFSYKIIGHYKYQPR